MAAEDPIFVWSSSSSDGNPESPTFYLLSNPSDYFRDDDLDNFFQNDAGHDHKHGLLTACSDQWTRNDNKLFESAIAELGSDTPNLFAAIAAKVPGKTVEEIEKHYLLLVEDLETIESGCFPVPQYADDDDDDDDDDESVMKNGTDNADDDEGRRDNGEDSKRKNKKRRRGKVPGEFRRRGTPWTDEEHSLFLAGLGKYGRGDWRSISRNYVITKTPTQVASHAQKYFLRMETNAANSDKRRRPSRLDQTLPNLPNHGNGMAMMDHLQNLTTAQNNNYRPIMPAPSPLVPQVPPPIYTSFTSNYDFVGANNRAIQNQYGGAISSSLPLPRMPAAYPTVPVTTMNLPSSSSLYDYNFSYGASSSMKHGPSQAGPSQILEELPMNYYQPTNSTYSFPQFPNYPM